ncbi:hypothetical protein RO3G_05113 [Rhizopus delemar RA 99-880]|uniref:Uncharacterized protein n=1 Tax=Rhizopus delemar (strain RA 99-880 / ATCC MYA-4621 / FGSC 9543 / NRRL 43880) TaxID=246409 RepID=I1BW28_RHIO9|nr:hypothetical protein RO3G_05113 [Rhizopus delemar RA 99-880]|eukprot:EIE80408.1 hypothetical protein RO3G_05113 [Rhizopus delemar RA 99-880]
MYQVVGVVHRYDTDNTILVFKEEIGSPSGKRESRMLSKYISVSAGNGSTDEIMCTESCGHLN